MPNTAMHDSSVREPASVAGWIESTVIASAYVGVVGLPWLFPTEKFWVAMPYQSFLAAIGVVALASVLWVFPNSIRRRPFTPSEWALLAFIALGSVPTIASPAPLGRLAPVGWWLQSAMIVMALSRLSRQEHVAGVLWGYSALAVVASLALALHRWMPDLLLPFVIQRNHFAFLLILPTFFFLSRLLEGGGLVRIVDAVGLIVVTMALVLTRSRAVWLGVACAAVLLVGVRAVRMRPSLSSLRRILMVAAIVCASLLLLDVLSTRLGNDSLASVLATFDHLDEGSIGGRIRRWTNTLPLIQDHLIFGVGLGNWFPAFEAYRHTVVADSAGYATALNTYLAILAETGLVGFTLFVLFLSGMLRRPFSSPMRAGVVAAAIAWLVALCFHSLYDVKIVAFGFSLVCGLSIWSAHQHNAAIHGFVGGPLGGPLGRPLGRPLACVIVALTAVLFALDARYSLARIERSAIARTVQNPSHNDRFLWRLIDPISETLSVPITRASLQERTAQIDRTSRFLSPDQRDLSLTMGKLYEDLGDPDTARTWYQEALTRNPKSVPAAVPLCRLADASADTGSTRESCERALSINPALPRPHIQLATLDERAGDVAVAIAHLETARHLLWQRLDKNDFGAISRHVVSGYYDDYRRVSDQLSHFRAQQQPSRETVLSEILQTPALHKSVAIVSCDLYFSANINARYNLWKLDLCAGSQAIEVQTNDSLSPFRLRGGPGRVYFISDQRGNGAYRLYALEILSGLVEEIDLPEGRFVTYEVSPDGEYLAVVKYSEGSFQIYLGGAATPAFEKVFESQEPLAHLTWHPSAKELLFARGGRVVHRIDSANRASELFATNGPEIGLPAYSPSGTDFAYTLRSGSTQSTLEVRRIGSREVHVVRESSDSVFANPLWLDEDTLAVREISNDEYLLRRVSLETGTASGIGPASGVVYTVAYDPESQALIFVAATETIPASIYRIPANQPQAEPLLRLDWIAPHTVTPVRREVIDASRDVVAYYYSNADAESPQAAVVWLHGGSSRFSPRWHMYAQYFTNAGYDFIALNYSEEWSAPGASPASSMIQQATETEALIRKLRGDGYESVFLLGVSKGTRILQEVLRRNFETVDAAIEYAPVNDSHWSEPQKLAPMITFTGHNDPLLDHRQRQRDIERHRALGSEIEWVVFRGEGHDLRGRRSIEARMIGSREFLQRHGG